MRGGTPTRSLKRRCRARWSPGERIGVGRSAAVVLQQADHDLDLGGGMARGGRDAGQPVGHVETAVGGVRNGMAQPVAGAVGLEPHGDQLDRSDGAQGQRPGHLAGEQGSGLTPEDAVLSLLLVGGADVDDQFGAAVRSDALHRRLRRGGGIGPDGAHEGTQRGGRLELLIALALPRHDAQFSLEGSGGAGGRGAQGTPSSFSFFTSAGVASP